MPSLTLLLDVPTARGFARLRRPKDRMERKVRAFHERVRRGYLTLARREPRRIVRVDREDRPCLVLGSLSILEIRDVEAFETSV